MKNKNEKIIWKGKLKDRNRQMDKYNKRERERWMNKERKVYKNCVGLKCHHDGEKKEKKK